LQAGSGHHGEQTAKMIEGIEKVLLSDHFDGVLVYGDTNSTLAGALAASKLNIPVFHVEAGLRSYNMSMPEEINRILCDQVSSLLFAPTQVAIDNLVKEGLLASPAQFLKNKERKVILSGDVMYDNSLYFATLAEQKSAILSELSLQKGDFILATIHRANNTDNAERLSAIFEALLHISEFKTVVLPLHPRTRKQMEVLLSKNVLNKVTNATGLKIIPPASFLDMILLEKQASMVITDSGGVQKEAFFFEKPCLIL
jgi:UDP-GlcNAc3NAcA epimerase